MALPVPTDPKLRPFALGKSGPRVLLVHGFTGTPFEMRYLGGYLARRGFRVTGIKLPGHGTDPYELERSGSSEWISEARAALLSFGDEPAFVAGLSMGALISLILAADHPERVRGLALCAPALQLRRRAAMLLPLASLGALTRLARFVDKNPSRLADRKMGAQLPMVDRIPSAAAAQFGQVQVLARLALPKVRAPALVVSSQGDLTVSPAAPDEVARRIGSRPARRLRLRNSSHILTLDVEREMVAREVETFFRELL